MLLQRKEVYEVGPVLSRTENSVLWRARAIGQAMSGAEGLSCVFKSYRDGVAKSEDLFREMRITQEIENNAPKSVVIPILQILEGEGKSYELLQLRENGRFLAEIIREMEQRSGKKGIPLTEMLEIFREIFVSLETLHDFEKKKERTGYLHLDLHPGNIFLESVDYDRIMAGRAKFIDFLTARRVREDGTAEGGGEQQAVTVGFSAPELYRRQEAPGTWTDVYSVCAIFYRMYTGRRLPARSLSGTEISADSIGEDILRAGEKRGDNPILVHMVRSFLNCGLERNTRYRLRNAKEGLEILDTILRCARACGSSLSNAEPGASYARPDYTIMLEMAYRMRIPARQIPVNRIAFDAEGLMTAVEDLVRSIYRQDNDMEKAYYFFNILWQIFVKNRRAAMPESYYRLVHSGMGICNKSGHLERADEIYRDLLENAEGIPLREMLLIRNTVTGTCQRLLNYEHSIKILEVNLLVLNRLYKAYREGVEILGVQESMLTISTKEHRRAMGAYGKHMAALDAMGIPRVPVQGLPKTPMEAYVQAHEICGWREESRLDWQQNTRSILHYAMQTNSRGIFEQYAPGIFGKKDPAGNFLVPVGVHGIEPGTETGFLGGHSSLLACYEDILARQELRNTIYVFLKGVYCFYRELVNEAFLFRLLSFIDEPRVRDTLSAPIELACRYCALLLRDAAERAKEGEGLSRETLLYGAKRTFRYAIYEIPGAAIRREQLLSSRMCRTYQTKAILFTLDGKEEELSELREQFLWHAETSGWTHMAKMVEEGRKLSELLLLENS